MQKCSNFMMHPLICPFDCHPFRILKLKINLLFWFENCALKRNSLFLKYWFRILLFLYSVEFNWQLSENYNQSIVLVWKLSWKGIRRFSNIDFVFFYSYIQWDLIDNNSLKIKINLLVWKLRFDNESSRPSNIDFI